MPKHLTVPDEATPEMMSKFFSAPSGDEGCHPLDVFNWSYAAMFENCPQDYTSRIVQWAEDRNLIEGATRQAQMLKMTEEVGELAAGIAKGKEPEVKDAIGDCFVVLTILAAQSGLTMAECIEAAYNTIKDRKGRMVDGVFVREE